MQNRILLLCLILSGYAGLAYELLWVRLLTLAFGSTTLSFSTVLAVFFAGLAIGSWLAAKYLHVANRPMRVYAVIEFTIGATAMAMYPVLANIDQLFAPIDPGNNWFGVLLRFLFAATAMAIPTILMGMTIPIACRAVIKDDDELGRGTSYVYGINTFGAFLGAYLITYHLLINFGVLGSTILTVCASLIAGAVAWVRDRDTGPIFRFQKSPQRIEETEGHISDPRLYRFALLLTFLCGFSFICFEVIWSRVFSIILKGSVYGIGAVLICILVGIALGSLIASFFMRKRYNPIFVFILFQSAVFFSVMAIVSQLGPIGYLLGTVGSIEAPIDNRFLELLGVFCVLFVPSVAAGTGLPLLVKAIETKAVEAGRSLGRLYTVNTIGSISASLITGFYLLPMLDSNRAILIGLFVILLTLVIASLLLRGTKLFLYSAPLVLLAVLSVVQFTGYDRASLTSFARPGPASYTNISKQLDETNKNIVYFSEGKSATVLVRKTKNDIGLSLNGLGQGARNFLPPHHLFESLLVGAMPILHHPQPESALIVGLGAGVTLDAVQELGIKDVEIIEIEPKVVNAVESIFVGEKSPMAEPGTSVHLSDARHYLLRNKYQTKKKYDVITSMPAHPWVASPIFTQEFFELVRESLTPQGVFSTWFGLFNMNADEIASLLKAFDMAFDSFIVYHVQSANALYVVGFNGEPFFNPEHIENTLRHEIFKHHKALHLESLATQIVAVGLPGQENVKARQTNTDDSAYIELHAPIKNKEKFDGDFASLLPNAWLTDHKLSAAARQELLVRVFEKILGTPIANNEEFRPVVLSSLETLEKKFTNVLTEEHRRYIQARRLLHSGEFQAAEDIFAQFDSDPNVFLNRLAAEYAKVAKALGSGTAPESVASAGALYAFYQHDPAQAQKAFARGTLYDTDNTFMQVVRAIDQGQAVDVGHFANILLPKVFGLNETVTLQAAELVARAKSAPEQILVAIEHRLNDLTQRRFQIKVREAGQLLAKQDLSGARAKFLEANEIVPLQAATWKELLKISVLQRDVRLLAMSKKQLRATGLEEDYVEAFVNHIGRIVDANEKLPAGDIQTIDDMNEADSSFSTKEGL